MFLEIAIANIIGSVLIYETEPEQTDGLTQIGNVWIDARPTEVTSEMVSDCLALAAELEQPQTLDDAIAQVRASISDRADQLRTLVLSDSSEVERAAWPTKAREAELYGSLLNENKAPLLKAEAAAAGIPLADLAKTVNAKATAYYSLEAQISGTKRKHLDAIAALETVDSILKYDYFAGWPDLS